MTTTEEVTTPEDRIDELTDRFGIGEWSVSEPGDVFALVEEDTDGDHYLNFHPTLDSVEASIETGYENSRINCQPVLVMNLHTGETFDVVVEINVKIIPIVEGEPICTE